MGASSDLHDLVAFLSHHDKSTRCMASEIVEGLTGTSDGLETLKTKAEEIVPALFQLLKDSSYIAQHAAVSLVNLSQDPAIAELLVKDMAVTKIMDYIREGKEDCHAELMMLIANLTQSEEGAEQLLQIDKGVQAGLHLAYLLGFFTRTVRSSTAVNDTYEQVAAIIVNATRFAEARKLLLEPGRGLLKALVMQLKSPSLVRRRGSASAVRNCCFSAEKDGTLLELLADEQVIRDLWQPISGMEPLEADDVVREACAEAILMLCETEKGSDLLWKMEVQTVLRKGYELEEHPGVCEAMERTIQTFMKHHREALEKYENGEGEQPFEDMTPAGLGLLPPAAYYQVGTGKQGDDDDSSSSDKKGGDPSGKPAENVPDTVGEVTEGLAHTQIEDITELDLVD